MATTTSTATSAASSATGYTGSNVPALVFGASGEEGRAVLEGMLEAGFSPVYAFTRQSHNAYLTDALGAKLWTGNIENPDDVRKALVETAAQAIYLVTTTNLSTDEEGGFEAAANAEYQVMVEFAHILRDVVNQQHDAKIQRHVVVSVRDNVQAMNNQGDDSGQHTWIQPLDDGSVVPHYSAKGKGGEYMMEYLQNDVKITLLTMPFFFSNFFGFFCPLPSDESKTQWTMTACLGGGGDDVGDENKQQPTTTTNKIDMMGSRDLKIMVPKIFLNDETFHGRNLRLVGQQCSMEEVAAEFADLFGKDVIYNPLTYSEMAALPFPAAPAMAQMCQFLSRPRSTPQDLEQCKQLAYPKHLQTFKDWLLVHSDSTAFEQVGLDLDAAEIKTVTVFGATSHEGGSVAKGLLADVRKEYKVRCTSRHVESAPAQALLKLDSGGNSGNGRVELVYADYDDKESCAKAVQGSDAAFLLTNLGHSGKQVMAGEERHVHNIIDACEAAHSIRHLVIASMMPAHDPRHDHHRHHIWNDEGVVTDDTNVELPLDAKAMAIAYARTKKISVTYITLPYSAETKEEVGDNGGNNNNSDTDKEEEDNRFRTITARDGVVAAVSMHELGPIVADIMDSYQVYAGHEIALVTDLVTSSNGIAGEQPMNVTVENAYLKDMGPVFQTLAHSDAVKHRQPIAKTLKLVPSSQPLKEWVQQHEEDKAFREKLGLR